MADVLIRDVPDEVLARLKRRAAAQGRSLQAELQELLVQGSGGGLDAVARVAARLRKAMKDRGHSDSGELQRQDRGR